MAVKSIIMFSPNFDLSNSGFQGSHRFYEIIQQIGQPKKVPKGRQIIKEGSLATFFLYIKKGAFKTIVKTTKKDFVLAFTFADDIDCCPIALLHNLPNNFSIEAVVNSEVLICHFADFKRVAGKDEYAKVANNILLHYAMFLEEQVKEFLSLTAEERYFKLLHTQPDKLKQIPLTLIASYLGITLERLSRIRKKIKALT